MRWRELSREVTPGSDYIRGAGGIAIDARRLVAILVGIGLLTLATLVVVLGVAAAGDSARTSRLRDHGVPVVASVTGCVALASGTGITASGFRCTATFTIGGTAHSAVLRGSNALYAVGMAVPAVVLPGQPASLTRAGSLRSDQTWRPFVTPAVILVVLVALVSWVLARRSRRPAAIQDRYITAKDE
jgi:hypothetical protein